ncbi:twin-arginine translocase subunit TatC [Halalkalibacillus sediminis]|uniref:Sec-independent protein translocase protein TatC n=1 Tax=Halalkalibacillus sediminis TaxID=2018042 RepID=A0A2I0QXG4_9BACI|nr:twin-arginine translocase subunit TatC [Halalkalibacillus sediminis]PKR78800.1 twin-arginine translocase subunit TatC [Halalkalibacillus sediminis]
MSSNKYSNPDEMHWTEHLGELRGRLIWSFVIFALFFAVGFYFASDIYQFIEGDVSFELNVLGPFEIVWVYLMIATIAGLFGGLPFLAFQLWLFISPALTKHEKRVSALYIPIIFILFAVGVGFGYIVIKDLVLEFLLGLSDGLVNEMFTAKNYFRFVLQMTIPFAFFFEVPLIAMFLTSLGMLNPQVMKKFRKYAYLVLVILGTMLSPPDFILQLIVAAPLILLYEISITLSGIVYRRKIKKLKQLHEES